MAVRRQKIRRVAEEVLEGCRINEPPVDIRAVAKSLGIVISRTAAEDDLSGFLFRDRDSGKCVIGVNDSHASNRRRFTVAHEIGHYLLHEDSDVHVDSRFQVKHRNQLSSEGTSDEEREANLFAAELLMPASFLEEDLAGIDHLDAEDDSDKSEIKKLAERYRVSTQAMTFRLVNLQFIEC